MSDNCSTVEKPSVSFALIGDVQYADREPMDGRSYRQARKLFQQTIAELNRKNLDFVVCLGDLGDGIHKNEVPEILEDLKLCRHPVRMVAGNHDLVLNTEEELLRFFRQESFCYDFCLSGFRFIVYHSFDVSRFAPPGSARYYAYRRYKEEHAFRELREWDGALSEQLKCWLQAKLQAAADRNEQVILLAHVPVLRSASGSNAVMWDGGEQLELFDRYSNLRAFFAGHYHPGGCAVRNGVFHKTVKAICNVKEPTALICRLYPDRLETEAVGEETSAVHCFEWKPAELSGRAVPGSWITSSTGEVVQADEQGKFRMTMRGPGLYTLKAVADGYADSFLKQILAPASGLEFTQKPEPGRKVVHGHTSGYALLKITDDGQPVRFFDLEATPFGSLVRPGQWHQISSPYWSRGEYAFSARGEVRIEAAPYFPELRAKGWYKGDFHAHIIHGENFYVCNLPLYAFAARAEHYDWLYCAQRHENGRIPDDPEKWCRILSDEKFLLRLNREFPKNLNGHVGNAGVPTASLDFPYDPNLVTNFELAEKYIRARGGAAIPVHPLYDDGLRQGGIGTMTNKEFMLWLLCEPELCPCLDLLYFNDDPRSLRVWFMLLNRGYRIGVTATSDAAFDVGRSPGCGGRGATLAWMDALTEENLTAAFRQRRTAVTWNGGAVLFSIDGQYSGAVLSPGGARRMKCEIYYRGGRNVSVEIIRNGKVFLHREQLLPPDGKWEFTAETEERLDAWYLALLRDAADPDRIIGAASPVYFRTPEFRPPQEYEFPRPFPPELKEMLLHLTVEELADEKLFDRIAAFLQPKKPSAEVSSEK